MENSWNLEIDLFTSQINHRLPRYCTRVADPNAVARDAFAIDWKKWRTYTFPPLALIPLVLSIIFEYQAWVLLLAPH